ncbi:MAG: MG2 domain-containing protein [Planctomycetota bacterium]
MCNRRRRIGLAFLPLLAIGVVWAAAHGLVWEKRVTTEKLGGKDRALLYVSTDKPIYREGETLYLRAVALKAADNTPIENGHFSIHTKIRGPKGDIVFQWRGNGQDSTAGLAWAIPAGTPGGRYTALVTSPNLGTPETERSFDIRAYRAPRLKTQIEFLREGYGPGDEVQATVEAVRAEGGIPVGARVTVIARVDGAEVFRQAGFAVGSDGTCSATFSLPDTITVGDGTLSFVIEDGGVLETASKTIPILLQTLKVAFYPEGGEMIAGLPGRVYVQANRPDGKPADLKGRVLVLADGKAKGREVATLSTLHEGRGFFVLTPKAGERYALLLDAPAEISKPFVLPGVRPSGAAIRSLQSVYPYEGSIAIHVNSTADSQAARVTLCKREVELDSQPVVAGKEVSVTLNPKDSEGVLIATLWDQQGHPLAERLVYRRPRFGLQVKITTEQKSYTPGGKVTLNVETLDENGRPVEAVVGITVTDDAVLEMIETREQAPRLPLMVYLENEVTDLADAHVYLDRANAEAPRALDLLLGTQGWRRFVLVRYEALKKAFPEDAKRILAQRVHPRPVLYRGRVFKGRELALPMAAAQAVEDGVVEEVKREIGRPMEPDSGPVPVPVAKPVFNLKEAAKEALVNMDVVGEMEEMAPIEDRKKRIAWVRVREYAHKVRPNRRANDRVDFTETLYWHAGIRTSARNGKASASFELSDSVTAFRVMADGFGRNGALGTGDLLLESRQPFSVEPKMPLEVTVGDRVEIPVALINATATDFARAHLLVRADGLSVAPVKADSLAAGARARRLVTVMPQKPGRYTMVFNAAADGHADSVTRSLVVKPKGFPVAVNHGGLIESGKPFATAFTLPAAMEPGSLAVMAKVFPTPLANMEEALNALLRQPHGCFERRPAPPIIPWSWRSSTS